MKKKLFKMEATQMRKKKTGISKGKLKKTIKNVICKPNSLLWPIIQKKENERLQEELVKYKIVKPEFLKLHWKDLKSIPKEKRPKCPAVERVEGTIFGIKSCCDAIDNQKCAAIIIESAINPRTIVQPVLEACARSNIPVVCSEGIRKFCEETFGIPTSCFGIKEGCLLNVSSEITELAKKFLLKSTESNSKMTVEVTSKDGNSECHMDTSSTEEVQRKESNTAILVDKCPSVEKCPYLYRNSSTLRVFVPPSEARKSETKKNFIGQDFIEFSDKPEQTGKSYMKMLVKRIANNPNRLKIIKNN